MTNMCNYKNLLLFVVFNPTPKNLAFITETCKSFDVIVVDNGSIAINYINNLKFYRKAKRNMGTSGAVRIARRIGEICNYDRLIIFDQDTEFDISNLNKILVHKRFPSDAGIVFSTYEKKERGMGSFIKTKTGILSGSIIQLSVFRKAGCYNSTYFMEYVDIEFCLRLLEFGYSNYRLDSWVISQKFGASCSKNVCGKTIQLDHHLPVRHFYRGKNLAKLIRKYHRNQFPLLLNIIKNQLKDLVKIILFEENSVKKIRAFFGGFFI